MLLNGFSGYYISTKIKGLLVATIVCCLSFVLTSPAYAESPGNLYPPFDVGSGWNVCQGYENIGGTHVGTSRLSLDLTSSGCDNGATGRVVRAPFTGTVSWYVAGSGSICVTAKDGRSIMMTHIDSNLVAGTAVDNYQAVGNIAGPNQRQNNGVAHIHLQAWSSPGCSNNKNQICSRRLQHCNPTNKPLCLSSIQLCYKTPPLHNRR